MQLLKNLLYLVAVIFIATPLVRLALTAFRSQENSEKPIALAPYIAQAVFGIGLGVVLIAIPSCFGQVPAGYQGIVLNFGAPSGELKAEGFYMVNPIGTTVEAMSVGIQAHETTAQAASKDLQTVTTKVTVNFILKQDKLIETYRTLRDQYIEKIVEPSVQEVVKATTAGYTAQQLITMRPEVSSKIEKALLERLDGFGIQLRMMSITDFDFSDAFNLSIEAKVKAEQDSLRALADLERVKHEAASKIENAKAEAESLRIQRENLTPDLIKLRQIEVQQRMAEALPAAIVKWNGALPGILMMGSSGTPLLNIDSK